MRTTALYAAIAGALLAPAQSAANGAPITRHEALAAVSDYVAVDDCDHSNYRVLEAERLSPRRWTVRVRLYDFIGVLDTATIDFGDLENGPSGNTDGGTYTYLDDALHVRNEDGVPTVDESRSRWTAVGKRVSLVWWTTCSEDQGPALLEPFRSRG